MRRAPTQLARVRLKKVAVAAGQRPGEPSRHSLRPPVPVQVVATRDTGHVTRGQRPPRPPAIDPPTPQTEATAWSRSLWGPFLPDRRRSTPAAAPHGVERRRGEAA
ncbi:MAG: hypothetical protein K0V04_22060 [Deltaproteobacteria bacterium]|nr:hypothetical protein [Deltaproteobacteria bacterium]